MKLDNPFSDNTRNIFLYVYACFQCGRSDQGLELHHITGRDNNSAFNACPLCKVCHSKIGHTNSEERALFKIVINFLVKENYKPVESDYDFIRQHSYLIL